MKKRYMFTPGPTMVPAEVLTAEAQTMIHHRTPEFSQILREVTDWLKELFGTEQEVFTIAGSGTAAMEAAIANTCCPGDKVICAGGGKFADRWAELCEAYGCDVSTIEATAMLANRVHIKERLRRVFMSAVTCVNNTRIQSLCQNTRRSGRRVSDPHRVYFHGLNVLSCIPQGFSFFNAAGRRAEAHGCGG